MQPRPLHSLGSDFATRPPKSLDAYEAKGFLEELCGAQQLIKKLNGPIHRELRTRTPPRIAHTAPQQAQQFKCGCEIQQPPGVLVRMHTGVLRVGLFRFLVDLELFCLGDFFLVFFGFGSRKLFQPVSP